MQLSTILSSILKLFATNPDLCADVYADATGEPYTDSIGQTLPRYCQWTGPDAPILNTDVCCDIDDDAAACVLPNVTGRCSIGSPYYCKYGQVSGAGVVCFQPFPSACALGLCVQAPDVPPPVQALLGCCSPGGACVEILPSQAGDCEGSFIACTDGVSNEDGTITCFDPTPE
jgi:hypothetical protein